jgi:His/Glu/Gln/Arg/opine family amino acid ABC transporter permease subunit
MNGFDFLLIAKYSSLLLTGASLTLFVVVLSFAVGFGIGTALALLSFLPGALPRLLLQAYSILLRSVPFIIALFIVYYGLPFAGIRLPSLTVGIFALALYKSAYYAEIIRASILALPRGQFESARAVGMSPGQAFVHVLAPQILRGLLPPSTNMTLTLIKESSILSTITVGELTYQGLVMQGETYAPLECFAAVSCIYWALCASVAWVAGRLEKRSNVAQAVAIHRNPQVASFLSFERPKTR